VLILHDAIISIFSFLLLFFRFAVRKLKLEASTHKSAMTHAGDAMFLPLADCKNYTTGKAVGLSVGREAGKPGIASIACATGHCSVTYVHRQQHYCVLCKFFCAS